MNATLADRVLVDLIERVERAHGAVEAAFNFEPTPEELHDLMTDVVSALGAAGDYLLELREQQHRKAAS
jgi:hypothetical protein